MTDATRSRVMTVVTVVVVLLAAAAFVRAQVLKQELAPIHDTKVGAVVAPGCDCPREVVELRFDLRERQSLSAAIVDEDGRPVRTLIDGRPTGSGKVALEWNGRRDDETLAPEGEYRLRVVTATPEREITLPDEIELRLARAP